jgi:hypothetical protein
MNIKNCLLVSHPISRAHFKTGRAIGLQTDCPHPDWWRAALNPLPALSYTAKKTLPSTAVGAA